MNDTATITLAKQLINIESITPNDNGCQAILAERLSQIGFQVTHLPSQGVSNFWAERGDTSKPMLIFAGHTDVVPPGETRQWATRPFTSTIRDGVLFGRGAADMKGALAAMVTACERFIEKSPDHAIPIGFMITSDEEGEATHGTTVIVDHVINENKQIGQCIIGEASSQDVFGDNIKIGRRGSLHGKLTIHGQQGHIAYPEKLTNPIHHSFKALDHLAQLEWKDGNEHFTPTSFQIYNIHADTGATNMIPGQLTATFNLRYSPNSTHLGIQQRITEALDLYPIDYHIDWNHSSTPFFSTPSTLAKAASDAVKKHCHLTPSLNTFGGTSDGRFITRTGCEIIELGPINDSIHKANEHVVANDLNTLSDIYEDMLTDIAR